MDLDKSRNLLSLAERRLAADNLAQSTEYREPRKVWVEDAHVFVESHDGNCVDGSVGGNQDGDAYWAKPGTRH